MRERESLPAVCRAFALALAILLICFFLPAQAEAQGDSSTVRIIVSASTPAIARGGSLPVTFTLEADQKPFPAALINASIVLKNLDTPTATIGGEYPVLSFQLDGNQRSRTFAVKVLSLSLEEKIEVTFFAVVVPASKFSLEPGDAVSHAWDAMGINSKLVLTVCDPGVDDCPVNRIKLKIRVYLEGALPRR